MKKTIAVLLALLVLAAFCGCAGPLDRYREYKEKRDNDKITALLLELAEKGEYEAAGEVLEQELGLTDAHRNGRSYDFESLYTLLAAAPAALSPENWAVKYAAAVKNDEENRFLNLACYQKIVRSFFPDTKSAVNGLVDVRRQAVAGDMTREALMEACAGSTGSGALIYMEGVGKTDGADLTRYTGVNFSLTAALDEARVPKDYADARYLVCLIYHYTETGRYSSFAAAKRIDATCELIDCATGETLFTRTIEGGPPPQTIPAGTTVGFGAPPTDAEAAALIIEAIRNIP
jgi:hypothetical protein